MGTQIQNKTTYFSGSYSTRDVNGTLGNNKWTLYNGHKAFVTDQCSSSFSRRSIDGYSDHEKEKLWQTILKHELIFKHQLEELHRLYQKQRDLMNEIKRKELQKPSDLPFADLSFRRYNAQPPFSIMEDASFISQERVRMKKCEYTEPGAFQQTFTNLKIPSFMCMNTGRDTKRDPSTHIGSDNDLKSNFCSRSNNVIDLNEPVQIEENQMPLLNNRKEAGESMPSNTSEIRTRKKETIFGVEISEGNNNRVETSNDKKIFGFSIVVPQRSPSNTSCITLGANNGDEGKSSDPNPSSNGSDIVNGKGKSNLISGVKLQIDLNLSVNEDDCLLIPPLSEAIVKIPTTEVDLKPPAILVPEFKDTNKIPSILPLKECKEQTEKLVKTAVEAIIAISSSSDLVKDITNIDPPSGHCDESLHWFANLVSSDNHDGGCNEESCFIPNGMDHFEYMTLNLKEINVEEYLSKSPTILEPRKGEEKTTLLLSKKPRRGQRRRGKQRKDFQRDVLPGIVSLSRHEVAEDFQSFKELFRSCGFIWQPNVSKTKSGRGRKRSGVLDKVSTLVCEPNTEKRTCAEVASVVEETGVTQWGKRMRRLPRRRCRMSDSSHT